MTQQRRRAAIKWALIVGNVMLGLLLTGYGLYSLNGMAETYLTGEKNHGAGAELHPAQE